MSYAQPGVSLYLTAEEVQPLGPQTFNLASQAQEGQGPEMQNSVSFPCQYIHRQGPVAPSSQLVLGPGQDSRDRENAREQTSLRPLLSFTLYFLGFGEKSAFFQTNQSSSS